MNKLLLPLLILLAFGLRAQEEPQLRPVLSAYTIEAGSAHKAQTYLSPLKYRGWATAFGYERIQAMRFAPQQWVMQLQTRLEIASTQNPARNATMWDLGLEARWGMMRRFNTAPGWTFLAGASTGIGLGCLYNARNSNNPIAAKATWAVNATGAAVWNGSLKKLPVCLRYQAEIPLAGMFFAPEYGELYYEIYLGNNKGLLRGAWPGNYFGLNNYLSADLRFGGTTLRLGYRCNILSSKASHNVSRSVEHLAVVGIVCEWLSLSPRQSKNCINPLY